MKFLGCLAACVVAVTTCGSGGGQPRPAAGWPAWRGPAGDGHCAEVPTQLKAVELLWKKPMAGLCSAGIAVAEGFVVVPDGDEKNDYYHCFRAETGREAWKCTVPNGIELDYGPAPRATPAIWRGKVYCLGARGDLRCLDLKTGRVLWTKDYRKDLGAGKLPTWGHCTAPRVVDGRLIVHPGKLYALDPNTGQTVWVGEAIGTNYSNFLVGTFGGVRQVIGYDSRSLGGWDVRTGRRLWDMEVDNSQGYIVPQPVAAGGRLVVTSESEDTRLYAFDKAGRIIERPLAESEDLAPEMATPTALGEMLLGVTEGLVCLDLSARLKRLWAEEKTKAFYGLAHVVVGNGRALVFGETGEMVLIQPERAGCRILARQKISRDTWAHPALVDGRLYTRDERTLFCYRLVTK